MRGMLIGIAIATKSGTAAYVPDRPQPRARRREAAPGRDRDRDDAAATRGSEAIVKVTHNGHFDFLVLANHGVTMRGMRFDTMIAAYLLGETEHLDPGPGLRPHADADPPAHRHHRQGRQEPAHDVSAVATDTACEYCCRQVDAQLQAADILSGELKARNLWPLFDDVEMPLMAVLSRMELTGVAVDAKPLVADVARDAGQSSQDIEREIYADVGHELNIGSPQQLSHGAVRRAGPAEDAQDEARLHHGRHLHGPAPRRRIPSSTASCAIAPSPSSRAPTSMRCPP